jgi:hypothetical protein
VGSVNTPGANYVGTGGPPPKFLLDLSAAGNSIAYVLFHDGGNSYTN